MFPDRLSSYNKELEFLKDKLPVRDTGHATWAEWKCSTSLLTALDSLNDSLLSLQTEGKRVIASEGLYGRTAPLTVVFYDDRENPDVQYIPFNNKGLLPIDLSEVEIPYVGWRAIAIEVDTSLIFARFHLKEGNSLITKVPDKTLEWDRARINAVDTLTRYNMSPLISRLFIATVPNSPSHETTLSYLNEYLSIYP